MADRYSLLVEALCAYLLLMRVEPDDMGQENESWVQLVRARNAFLDDKETA